LSKYGESWDSDESEMHVVGDKGACRVEFVAETTFEGLEKIFVHVERFLLADHLSDQNMGPMISV